MALFARSLPPEAGRERTHRLAELLADQGRVDELRALADAGDGYAAHRLAELLVEAGDREGALNLLRHRADAGDPVSVLARELQSLRERAGMSYRQLSRKTGSYSAVTLVRALSGDHPPPWDVVSAVVSACGEDPGPWHELWDAAYSAAQPLAVLDSSALDATRPARVEALGTTGMRVAQRVGELRQQRGLTLAELEDRLLEVGRPILLSALSKIEQGQRRVDADDLVALALALDVSPNMLLLPGEIQRAEPVALTETRSLDAQEAWQWASRDTPPSPTHWDFFVSYTAADRGWAEWVAWQLEEAGFRSLVQDWDFVPGSNWTIQMKEGVARAPHTIVLLSNAYLQSTYGRKEWQAALAADPSGATRRLLPIRIEDCERPGLLGQIVSVDLFGCPPDAARQRLLNTIQAARAGRVKPETAPSFPEFQQLPGRGQRERMQLAEVASTPKMMIDTSLLSRLEAVEARIREVEALLHQESPASGNTESRKQ